MFSTMTTSTAVVTLAEYRFWVVHHLQVVCLASIGNWTILCVKK